MSDLRTVIMEAKAAHKLARGWNYIGSRVKCDETHLTGMVCVCGWARMSNDPDVVGAACNAHDADVIVDALVAAGFLTDDRLALDAS